MARIEEFLSGVAWRLGAERLLRRLALWVCGAAALGGALVLTERLVSLGAPVALLAAVPLLAGTLAGLVLGVSCWPNRMACALEADARFHLDERVSSALSAGEGPMADLVRTDAERHTQAIDLRRALPVRLPRRVQALALLLPALALGIFVPPLDLLGLARHRAERAAEGKAVNTAAAGTAADLQSLRNAAEQRGRSEAGQALQNLQQLVAPLTQPNVTPAEAQAMVQKAKSALDAAEKANRSDLDADLLAQARRELERLTKALPGGTTAAASGQEKGEKGAPPPPTAPPQLVKATEAAPKETALPPSAGRPIQALIEAKSSAIHEATPWKYRGVVQRYFSPEE